MSKPDNSMDEGYIFYEALGLSTKYMENFGPIKRCVWDANEKENVVGEVFEGLPKSRPLLMELHDIAHLYIFENHETLCIWLQ